MARWSGKFECVFFFSKNIPVVGTSVRPFSLRWCLKPPQGGRHASLYTIAVGICAPRTWPLELCSHEAIFVSEFHPSSVCLSACDVWQAPFLLPNLELLAVAQDRLTTTTTAERSHPAMAADHLHDCDDPSSFWRRFLDSLEDTY